MFLAFSHSFQHQKTVWLRMPCTCQPVSVFSHVEGFFMLTVSVDIYVYRESLATLPNPSFLKLWDIPVFTCFYFKTGNEKTKPYFSYFCESLLQISGRLVEKEQLCPAERK